MRILRETLLTTLLATTAGSLTWLGAAHGATPVALPMSVTTNAGPRVREIQPDANWDKGATKPVGSTKSILRRLPRVNDAPAAYTIRETQSPASFPLLDQPLSVDTAAPTIVATPVLPSPSLNITTADLGTAQQVGAPVLLESDANRAASGHLATRQGTESAPTHSTKTETEPVEPVFTRQELLQCRLPREVVARTESMLTDATTLANRSAQFAARKQFEKIMRVTCQSLDAQLGRPIHSRALARGLRAVEEAEDFALNGDSAEFDLQLGGFVEGHSTPVLKKVDPHEITALRAMQAYYRYAVEQLTIAGNNEPISSKALFAMGRIESLMSSQTDNISGGGPKALAFYHAAIAVNPANGRAANELGVMLARRGRALDAQNMFLQASATEPTAVVNLSKLYRQMGNIRGSQQMEMRARQIAARNPRAFVRGPSSGVRFVDHATFTKEGAGTDPSPADGSIRTAGNHANSAKPQNQAAAAAFLTKPKADAAKPTIAERLKAPFGWGR